VQCWIPSAVFGYLVQCWIPSAVFGYLVQCWIPSAVAECNGPLSNLVQVAVDRLWKEAIGECNCRDHPSPWVCQSQTHLPIRRSCPRWWQCTCCDTSCWIVNTRSVKHSRETSLLIFTTPPCPTPPRVSETTWVTHTPSHHVIDFETLTFQVAFLLATECDICLPRTMVYNPVHEVLALVLWHEFDILVVLLRPNSNRCE
jgi:hypothetical protein